MIRYIQRDELTHLDLFARIWEELKNEHTEVFTEEFIRTQVHPLIMGAVEREIIWGKHVIEPGVMGLTDGIIENFIQHRADEVCDLLKIPRIYNVTNAVPWFYNYSAVNRNEPNFFEAKVTDYEGGLSGKPVSTEYVKLV